MMRMLLTSDERNKNNYVIYAAVLQRLIDAAAARYSEVSVLLLVGISSAKQGNT